MQEKDTVTLVGLKTLRPAGFLKTLFPFGRDWPLLRESFGHYGYKSEFAIVARPLLSGEGLEIVDGVGRATLAREAGVEKIPALVKAMEDEEARRYAIESNLYRAETQANIKLIPAIVLAREHQRSGGEYRVERILKLTGVSRATYKRAVASLNFAIETLRTTHAELGSCADAEVVATCMRRKLWPEFTQFYQGGLEPFGFYKRVYGGSTEAKARRKKRPQGRAEETQPQSESGVAVKSCGKDLGRILDTRHESVTCLTSFLEMAKSNSFVRQISEHPELHHEIDARRPDIENIVKYLEDLTAFLKARRQERRGEIKKARPREKRQFDLLMSDATTERHA